LRESLGGHGDAWIVEMTTQEFADTHSSYKKLPHILGKSRGDGS
jgi:hypothetical protein